MEKVFSGLNKIYQILLPVVTAGLVFQITVTTLHNRRLKSELEAKWLKSGPSIQMLQPEPLKPGEKIEAFTAPDLNNVEMTIPATGTTKKTVLLAFTTSCPACKANAPNWVKLYDTIDRNRWDVIGLSLDDVEKTKTYVAEKGYRFPVVSLKDKKEIAAKLKIQRIPTTLALDQDLKVIKTWVGGIQASQKEINEILELKE